ncbi:TetR/AcrR family transcriptional regulator [Actinomadura fibrosa]|uniref:TetR/AcrR family transcriptional regulator n=3 Tax=Actinomadura fibrosa TaxID=111802 RepID=A0ABW2XZ36_9ACTN
MDTRPMRADARRNHERLVATARAAFLEHGTGASLDDIARRAGVGSGTLYRHFPTRDDLLHAVLRDWIDALLADAEALLAGGDGAGGDSGEVLAGWLRAYLSGAAAPRGTAAVLVEALSARAGGTCTALGGPARAICDATARLLARAQDAGTVRADVDARDLLRLANAIGIAAERAPEPAAYAGRMLALLFDGLRTGGRPPDGGGGP